MADVWVLVSLVIAILIHVWLPLHYFFYLKSKYNVQPVVFGLGVVSFIIAFLVKIPLIVGVRRLVGLSGMSDVFIASVLVAAIAVSICENLSRYFVVKLFTAEEVRHNTAMTFGLGFGWCKSLLVGLMLLSMAIGMVSFELGDYSQFQGTAEYGQASQTQVALSSVDPAVPLFGSLNRIFDIVIAMCLSVFAFAALHKIKYLFYAIGLQFVFEFLILYGSQYGAGFTAFVGMILALSSMWIMLRNKGAILRE